MENPQPRAVGNNNSKAETNEGLNPQFNALHSSQRSYNALIKDQQTNSLVSLAAVFSIVTQRCSRGEERCVTILKTAARETKT